MCMTPEMSRYFLQLNGYLHHQNQQIEQMNKLIQQLVREVDQLNRKLAQPQTIHNEYKFDLLKVERLDGTLNIGIRPTSNEADSSIGEFAVGQSVEVPTFIEKQHPQLSQNIQQQIDDYLDQDAYRRLELLENKYQYQLDDPYRKFIIEDVKKQIDKRISHYLNQNPTEVIPKEDVDKLQDSVIEKVKQDIDNTFETFIRNLPRKENRT